MRFKGFRVLDLEFKVELRFLFKPPDKGRRKPPETPGRPSMKRDKETSKSTSGKFLEATDNPNPPHVSLVIIWREDARCRCCRLILLVW